MVSRAVDASTLNVAKMPATMASFACGPKDVYEFWFAQSDNRQSSMVVAHIAHPYPKLKTKGVYSHGEFHAITYNIRSQRVGTHMATYGQPNSAELAGDGSDGLLASLGTLRVLNNGVGYFTAWKDPDHP